MLCVCWFGFVYFLSLCVNSLQKHRTVTLTAGYKFTTAAQACTLVIAIFNTHTHTQCSSRAFSLTTYLTLDQTTALVQQGHKPPFYTKHPTIHTGCTLSQSKHLQEKENKSTLCINSPRPELAGSALFFPFLSFWTLQLLRHFSGHWLTASYTRCFPHHL